MEVAAACLAAVDRMRPDPSWTPPPGVLFVRFLVSPWNNEVEFAYVDDAKDPSHHRSIARIRNWQGGPYFGGSVECAKGNHDHAGTGAAIVRRVADADDVEALFRLWQSHVAVSEFMASVGDDRGLCPESKALIRRAHRRGYVA